MPDAADDGLIRTNQNTIRMKKLHLKTMFLAAALAGASCAAAQVPAPDRAIGPTFTNPAPDYRISPCTGMTRQGWIAAARYLLEGAFSYVRNPDDPMYFPKQLDKTYPRDDAQVPTAKLEGLCRTLFLAVPLLREDPRLTLNGVDVASYYRRQLVNLTDPASPTFIPRQSGGPAQSLVEFGGLAISLSLIPDILWDPLTQEQKDRLADTMLSYGNGPTIHSNWMFFNVFVISFFKERGYPVNERRLRENLDGILKLYRGGGWYNDSPAYDYYSMWAFQTYGPLWARLYGHLCPECAAQFLENQRPLADNYPYMFSTDGRMNMWGRSIPYRFAAVTPLALLGFREDPSVNYGWLRRIASSTLLQFLQNPDFLQDNVPTMGFYGPFAPAVQIYSCRGSVYWCGKAFLSLLLPPDNPFWTAVENNGPWEKEFRKGQVYNRFQPETNLLVTDYPDCGGAEMRSWCHVRVADDWQKFRSSENYDKLAYHTEFPWMADGPRGEVSMNYATLNAKGEWEVLRLYTFRGFQDGIYRRDAELETDSTLRYRLADIPLPGGVLRVDKVVSPFPTKVRLGHYALPETGGTPLAEEKSPEVKDAVILRNGTYRLALVPLRGWETVAASYPEGLHPVSRRCGLVMAETNVEKDEEKLLVTLMLWKKGDKEFTKEELSPVKEVKVSGDLKTVDITFADKTVKRVSF